MIYGNDHDNYKEPRVHPGRSCAVATVLSVILWIIIIRAVWHFIH
jgi:hypothetical protein